MVEEMGGYNTPSAPPAPNARVPPISRNSRTGLSSSMSNNSTKSGASKTGDSPKPAHFIRHIIAADVEAGLNSSKVHTRFPPEPNGYLHIGHAKSICLNFGMAEEFGGLCNLRFDDTNPEKESDEYIQSIQEDVRWLGFQWNGDVHYASDYFDQLYDWAVYLIEHGKAYVCHLTPEQAREYRGSLTEPGKDSPYRRTQRRGKPRLVWTDEGRRLRRWRVCAARED
jgi:glutaminyl-tRNA synthetase